MAEEEVNYSSVVFKTKKHSPPEDLSVKKEEETVYDQVKAQSETTEQTADTNVSAGVLPDKKANDRCRHYQQLAFVLGILCVILLLGIIAVYVYLTFRHKSEQNLLQDVNCNLTNHNNKLSSENEILRKNLTRACNVSERNIRNLTEENQNLTRQNQQLETERNNLTQQIQNMETSMELNISRAQWSIDAYCRQKGVNRCKPCQEGWLHSKPSCYAYNNPAPSGQKTWKEAREDCRGKISDLAVIVNDMEKTFFNSWKSLPNDGLWIGLRVEDGRWQWVDGSELTETSWIQQPATDGHCAVFFRDKQWTSMNCSEKQQWLCKKDALSV